MAYRLQLSSEELIYEFWRGSFNDGEVVELRVDITYAQAMERIAVEVVSGGAAYDPFRAESEAGPEKMEHMGITLLKKKADSFSYAYEEGKNRVLVEFVRN